MGPSSVPREIHGCMFNFSSICICSLALYSYESFSFHPDCLTVPSSMFSAVAQLHVVTFAFSLLLLPHLPDPELHPLATATHAVFYGFLDCVLLDQSPSQAQSYS